MKPRQKIAIVGSGISGLTAAYHLSANHDVTLYEGNDYIGGHTHTVNVNVGAQNFYVDTGFIVCNDRNYPDFLHLMGNIGVELQATEMSFSVRNPALNLEYNGHNLNTLFAQRRNLLRPSFYRLLQDILRLNNEAKNAQGLAENKGKTLGMFLDEISLSQHCRDNYLLPMVAAIWSCSIADSADFPLDFFLGFFLNHGLLDIKNRPQWYVLKGGSHSYIPALTAPLHDRIRLNAPVGAVRRHDNGIEVVSGPANDRDIFDRVVLACHSDQALRVLEHPSQAERSVLQAIPYQQNEVILHTDSSLMPSRKAAWASWNFIAGNGTRQLPPVVTYCMNILQRLPAEKPILVSLNARDRIREDCILGEYRYSHPGYSLSSQAAQARRAEICGADRIHYCGAYWYNGFHEDGVRSALDVCRKIEELA